MRILMVTSGYYPECCGGVEVMAQSIAEGLVKRGNEVTVVFGSNQNDRYNVNGVEVYKWKPFSVNFGNNQLSNHVNRLLQMYNPFEVRKYEKWITQIQPDVIHLHMARTLSMSFIKAAENLRIPVVSTLHEYFSLWNFDPFHRMEDVISTKPQFYVEAVRMLHRKITSRVKYVTAPMKKTYDMYVKEGYYSNSEFHLIENALPPLCTELTDRFIMARSNRRPLKYLYIGRLMPFKGVKEGIEAFNSSNLRTGVELHIAGDGPFKEYVENACKASDRIFYHGYVIDQQKELLFEQCDVLLFPTTELETCGLVAIEAFQRCMPAVASNVEALRKLVIDGCNGILINCDDYSIEADAIVKTINELSDDDYARMIGWLNTNLKTEKYDHMLQQYECIYRKATEYGSE